MSVHEGMTKELLSLTFGAGALDREVRELVACEGEDDEEETEEERAMRCQ